jgi:flagellar basal-body rod protein FlgB
MTTISLVSSDVVRIVTLALDAATLRQQVTASNIANAGIAGFQRSQVSFEEQLRGIAARLDLSPGGIEALRPRVVSDRGPAALDQDVTAMAGNAIHYQALLKALNAELDLMGLAASDGRR